MKRHLLALVALVGCAHEETRPAAAACPITEVAWAASETDYSQALTADTLDKLNAIIRDDREAFRADPSGHRLGTGLTELNAQMKPTPFVAHSALVSATRLRQLECAVMRGTFNGRNADVDHLYGEILGDVEKDLKVAKAR